MTVEPNTQTGSKKEAVKDRVENSGDTGGRRLDRVSLEG